MATTINSYKAGNTVRFTAEFRDFANNLSDPTLIIFRVYDQAYNKVGDYPVDLSSMKSSTGVYFYDYTIPSSGYTNQKLYYEFYGEVSGSPSLNRSSFKVVFSD